MRLFYKELFSSDPNSGGSFIRGKFPSLAENCKLGLEGSVFKEEVRRALEEIGSFNAPRLDGFHACFFNILGILQDMLCTYL